MRNVKPMSGGKDYNLVSNRYIDNNTARQAADKEASRLELFNKFNDTHNYNHIQARYYDDKKEDAFVKMRDELQKTNGLMQVEWLPESIKQSEGNLYDIVNQAPANGDAARARLAKWERKQARKFDAKITTEFEKKMKTRQQEEYNLKRSRQMNR